MSQKSVLELCAELHEAVTHEANVAMSNYDEESLIVLRTAINKFVAAN